MATIGETIWSKISYLKMNEHNINYIEEYSLIAHKNLKSKIKWLDIH